MAGKGMQGTLPGRVRESVRKHGLAAPGDRLLLAVSGGPDSVALARIMASLAPELGIGLALAHVNHRLRGADADADEAFVRELSSFLGLAFFCGKKDVARYARARRMGIEEAGRRLRRAFLAQTAEQEGFTGVALGHHADDAAETVLMALLRGTGLSGLAGIPAREGRFVRPLIDSSREEILVYLAEEKIPFRVDESNRDTRFLRNRVRHEILPRLSREENPGLSRALLRLAGIAAEEEAFWRAYAADFLGPEEGEGARGLDAARLAGLLPAARRRVFREAYRRLTGSFSGLSQKKIDAALALSREGAESHLGSGLVACLRGGRLHLEKRPLTGKNRPAPRPAPGFFEMLLPGPGTYPVPGTDLALQISPAGAEGEESPWKSADPACAWLDAERFVFPALLRRLLPGDRFRPLNGPGSRKASLWLKDRKIPGEERARALALVSEGRIAWLAPFCPDHHFRVREDSKSLLRVRLVLANAGLSNFYLPQGS